MPYRTIKNNPKDLEIHEDDVIFASKQVRAKMFDGRTRVSTFNLHKHQEGTKNEWWAIVRVGLYYLKDEFVISAGNQRIRTATNVGQPKYIQKIWEAK